MVRKGLVMLAVALAVLPARPRESSAEYILNFQGAAVFTGMNDVRIPGDGGTKFSLSDELHADAVPAGRVEAGYLRRGRDFFGIVIAPLSVDSHGSVDRDVTFNGATFPAGTRLDATFRFDSYRLTWRRKLIARDDVDVWLGLTAKVRDAAISVEGGGQRSKRSNTGFVPLVDFLLDWRIARPWSLRVAGDALVAPQGRAEDVLLALVRDIGSSTKLFAGYRILEGGADNDDVYTFSLFHYVVAGVETRF